MRTLVLPALLAVSATLACSNNDPCDTYNSAVSTLTTEASACASATDGGAAPAFSVSICDSVINNQQSCTSFDQTNLETALSNYKSCVGTVGTCSSSSASTWSSSISTCFATAVSAVTGTITPVSTTCIASLTDAGLTL
jgi:hypothetical protein